MLKLSLEKGSILSAIQKTQLKNYGCSWSTMFKAWTYEEKDAQNIEHFLRERNMQFTSEYIADIDKGKSVKEKSLETRIDILTEQTYTARTALSLELKAFDEDMILADLDNIPLKDAYETAIQFAKIKDLHERWLAIKAQEKELENLITSQESQEKESVVFKRHSIKDLLNRPPKEWYVNQVFGKGDIGEIFGASGSGKTFITIDLIMSLCTGRAWANSFDVSRPFEVAYCAGEGISGLSARFHSAMDHYGLEDLPNFSFFDEMPQFFGEDGARSISKFVQQCKNSDYSPDILIIDTFHTATQDLDENSTKDAGIVLNACHEAMKQLGCSIIFIHHTNKAGGDRGSTAFRAAMDFMIKVEAPQQIGRTHKMYCDKLKDGQQWKEKQFDLKSIDESAVIAWNELCIEEEKNLPNKKEFKEIIVNQMRQYPGIRFKASDFAKKIHQSNQYCSKLLVELSKEGICFQILLDQSKPKDSQNPWMYFI